MKQRYSVEVAHLVKKRKKRNILDSSSDKWTILNLPVGKEGDLKRMLKPLEKNSWLSLKNKLKLIFYKVFKVLGFHGLTKIELAHHNVSLTFTTTKIIFGQNYLSTPWGLQKVNNARHISEELGGRGIKAWRGDVCRNEFPGFYSLDSSSFDMKIAPVTQFPSWHMQQKLPEKPFLSGQMTRTYRVSVNKNSKKSLWG